MWVVVRGRMDGDDLVYPRLGEVRSDDDGSGGGGRHD